MRLHIKNMVKGRLYVIYRLNHAHGLGLEAQPVSMGLGFRLAHVLGCRLNSGTDGLGFRLNPGIGV